MVRGQKSEFNAFYLGFADGTFREISFRRSISKIPPTRQEKLQLGAVNKKYPFFLITSLRNN